MSTILQDLLNVDSQILLSIVSELTQATPPLAYVLGYDQARIVSVFHLHEWTVQVTPPTTQKQAQPTLVFPRRWLDIHGNMIESFWKMALRTVVGAFIYRPTMSEVCSEHCINHSMGIDTPTTIAYTTREIQRNIWSPRIERDLKTSPLKWENETYF